MEPYAALSRTEYSPEAGVCQVPHLRWKFLQNPFGPTIGIHLYDGDELIGRIASMPQNFRQGSKIYRAAHLVDTLVHPKHRKLAPLLRFAEGIHQLSGFDFLLFTPNDQAEAFTKYVLKVPRVYELDASVIPLKPLQVLCGVKKLPLSWAAPVVDGCWRILIKIAGAAATATSRIAISTQWPGEKELDAMLGETWPDAMTGVRTTDFLKWRFQQGPVFQYTTYFLRRAGKLAGYIAVRRRMLDGHDCQFVVDAFGLPDLSSRDWSKAILHSLSASQTGTPELLMAFGNTSCGPLAAATRHFVRIPAKLSPRKMTLFAKRLADDVHFDKEHFGLALADIDMV